jgi:hypothetical protein
MPMRSCFNSWLSARVKQLSTPYTNSILVSGRETILAYIGRQR